MAATVATRSPPAEVETLIQSADQAFAAQRFAGRDGNSAAELYQRAAQAAPQDARARSGLTRSVDFALRNAEAAFTDGRYAESEAAIAALQALAPGNSRLAFLSSQLQRERERSSAEENRRLSVEARQDKLRSTLQQAGDRLRRGALIEPERDNALELLLVAQDLAPGDADVRALRDRLNGRLLESATQKLEAGDVVTARGLLDAAGSLGADNAALGKLRRRADELHAPAAAPRETRAEPAVAVTTPPAPTVNAPPADPGTAPASTTAATTPPATSPVRGDNQVRIYPASDLTLVRKVEVEYPGARVQAGHFRLGRSRVHHHAGRLGAQCGRAELRARGRVRPERADRAAQVAYKPVVENGQPIEAHSRIRLRFTPAPL